MKKKLRRLLLLGSFLLVLQGTTPNSYAQEVRSVETDGQISFIGSYPIDTPDPTPPSGPDTGPDFNAKPPATGSRPGGQLPQTNTVAQSGLVLLGVGMLLFAFWLKKRKPDQKDLEHEKAK